MNAQAQVSDTDFRVRDEVALPATSQVIHAAARRHDVYPIHVTTRLADAVELLGEQLAGAHVAVITDATVDGLHGEALRHALHDRDVGHEFYVLPPGEASKSTARALELWDWLASTEIERRDVILTFGGGVINDLGGWVASAYMRGLRYINLPTTLLAQVDGAMGGKVAANHPSAKNLLGAFYQPVGVVSNVDFLATLDVRHIRAGLAECIKKAIIASPAYWQFIDENLGAILTKDVDALERLVRCAAAIKTVLIERDPYEDDLRRPLNFGHTVGHPVETVTGYGPLLHGEAVAFGMAVESRIAASRGILPQPMLDRIIGLIDRSGLPTSASKLPVPIAGQAILDAMRKVRLIRAGSLRYVLPVDLGETVIADDVADAELWAALEASGVNRGL
jgi:3-dehydroquinate synthase